MTRVPVRASVVSVLLALALSAPTVACAASLPSANSVPASVALAAHRWVGFYVPTAPGNLAPLQALEAKVGVTADFANYYQNVVAEEFTAAAAGNAISHGSMPLITLEFWQCDAGKNQPSYSLKSITEGAHDEYLHRYARQARAFGSTVWLRPLHEMNGDWYPWGGTVNGNTPSDFVPAWRHIHDIFAEEGADNVKFVWCPNGDSVPSSTANAIRAYWPGDDYVDYMALDGYNRGVPSWTSFSGIFRRGYDAVTVLSDKPLFVAETACSAAGGDKAAWISDMLKVIPTTLPRILGVGWFSRIAERDWRVDSSAGSLAAFRAGIRNSTWSSRVATSVSIKSDRSRIRRNGALLLSGTVRGGPADAGLTVYVRRPGTTSWKRVARTVGPTGAWRYRLTPRLRGTYSFKTGFAGDAERWGSMSRTIKVAVR